MFSENQQDNFGTVYHVHYYLKKTLQKKSDSHEPGIRNLVL